MKNQPITLSKITKNKNVLKILFFIVLIVSYCYCNYNIDKYYDSINSNISPGRINNNDNKLNISFNLSKFSTKELNTLTKIKIEFLGDFTPQQFSLQNSEIDQVSKINLY